MSQNDGREFFLTKPLFFFNWMYFAYKRFPAERCPVNIFKLLAVFAVVSIAACASDSSPSGAEPDENSSTEIPSSSASYGVVPVDTTIRDYVDPIEGMISSASKTSYNFSTERTILFDSTEIFVAAYFQDRAVQGFADRAGGSATFTYRLLKSADSGGDFVGWLLSGGYWSDDCISDSAYFVSRCLAQNGELVDYNNGCSVNKLQLSCVYPYEIANDSAALNMLAREFLEFARESSSGTADSSPGAGKSSASALPEP